MTLRSSAARAAGVAGLGMGCLGRGWVKCWDCAHPHRGPQGWMRAGGLRHNRHEPLRPLHVIGREGRLGYPFINAIGVARSIVSLVEHVLKADQRFRFARLKWEGNGGEPFPEADRP